MRDLMDAALLTARREGELCSIRRADVGERTYWVRNVKHPRLKAGNDMEARLLPEARALFLRQPDGDLIFPYDARSVSSAFTRACKVLGIDNLHFHDLRHEATSRLFERGYSIPEVAKFTLHLSWATLQRYTHLKPGDVPER